MKMHPLRVAMPPHGLIFGGNEAYGLQDAFGSVPGPPGPQKLAKNVKIGKKRQQIGFWRFLVPIFPLKEANNSLEYCILLKGIPGSGKAHKNGSNIVFNSINIRMEQ